ncbi:hypothetical protein BC629DRAFT_1547731 [Irpex lacteus]|nr:hypothetical protein BC629DRAFT_1547731 [Irpex lacteus]
MPFGHNHKNTTQGVDGYDQSQSVGPLGTGAGPERQPAVAQPYETRAHPTTGGPGAYHDQGLTYLPPQQQQGGMNDPYADTVGNNDVAPRHFTTGKIERVIGTVLHNPKLKAKGIEKEREAQALQAQKHEAGLRRERAVQHGAHPANKALVWKQLWWPRQDSSALGPNAPLTNNARGQLL